MLMNGVLVEVHQSTCQQRIVRYKAMYELSLSGKLDNRRYYACTENFMETTRLFYRIRHWIGF